VSLGVRAALHDAALLEGQEAVHSLDGGEPVRDDERDAQEPSGR